MKTKPSKEEIDKDERFKNFETRMDILCKRMKVATDHRQTLILRMNSVAKHALSHHSDVLAEIVDLLNTNIEKEELLEDKPFTSNLQILINTMEKVLELRKSNKDVIQLTQAFDSLPSLIPIEGLLSREERLLSLREESIEQREAAYDRAEELLDTLSM